MTSARRADRVLILGGGGMVGIQVAREVARELAPAEIIISALTQNEVDDALAILRSSEGVFKGEAGDIFLPQNLQGRSRAELTTKRELFDELFDDIFSPEATAYKNSALYTLIDKHKPDVIVDCINTATAISYQDVYTTSRRVKMFLDRIEEEKTLATDSLSDFVQSIRELLVAQGVPQITRHILFLHRALRDSSVRVYVKVGTTGTGGMGINIPYTHSEDRPSATLLSKSAIGFAHTGLLFLLARTPGSRRDGEQEAGTMIKEVKPGAMIGFKRLGVTHVRLASASGRREPAFLITPRREPIGDSIAPRDEFAKYARFENRDVPLKMVGADTGENGFFSIGEFQAITYPRQMEYVTPEEVARTVVLEILGASTGRDVISAIDGAITEPSYRAGVLRQQACEEMERLEAMMASESDVLPSIAIGHLGPPRLSKLLIEAFLLRAAARASDFDVLLAIEPDDMEKRIESYLQANPRVESLIATIGIPVLREMNGERTIARGPRLNIPVPLPDGSPLPLDHDAIERYAHAGWVDLRRKNFEEWRARLRRIASARPDIAQHGSAALDPSGYLSSEFVPGDVVGWLLTNETDEMGMVGHRVL